MVYVKTWKEKIMDVLLGTENELFWYTPAKIYEGLNLTWKHDRDKIAQIYGYLMGLVRSGHVERGHMPNGMSGYTNGGGLSRKYVWRATGKPFKAPKRDGLVNVDAEKAEIAYRLYYKCKHLPRWYRRMMV